MIRKVMLLLHTPSYIHTSDNDTIEIDIHGRAIRMVKNFEMLMYSDMEMASIDGLKKELQRMEYDKSTSNKE